MIDCSGGQRVFFVLDMFLFRSVKSDEKEKKSQSA